MDDETARRQDGKVGSLALPQPFVIAGIGLTNRQGWAAGLGELARRRDGGRVKMKSRPRSAAAMSGESAGTRAGNQKSGFWTLAQGRSSAIAREGLSQAGAGLARGWCATRGETVSLIFWPCSCSARRNSYCFCRFSQKSGLVPNQ